MVIPAPMVLKTTCSSIMKRKRDPSNPDHLQENPSNLKGPVAILWDMENCCIPNGVSPEEVAGNIRKSLHMRGVTGPITTFSAYGDFNNMPRSLREGCQRSGVNLIDVPNGRKDAADKAILADMFLFALDNFPPSTILLISSDVDFASALNKLGQRGYAILVSLLNFKRTSSTLWNAAKFVWEWPKMARNQCCGESADQILRTKKFKVAAAEASVNDAFFSRPNRGCWNLQFQSWDQGKYLLQQSQKYSNTQNQNNVTKPSNCGFPSKITNERNLSSSVHPLKTKPGDCAMPSETTEPNPISLMQPNKIQPGDCQISSETTKLYASLLMHPSNSKPGDWGRHSKTKAESNPSSLMQPCKIGPGDFRLTSETTEPNPTSAIQTSNVSPDAFSSMPNQGCWNLQFQSWGKRKDLFLQSQKNSNTQNQNNITEASDCVSPSNITTERNPAFLMQPSKTKPGDCGMPLETTESNPISLMRPNNIMPGECQISSDTIDPYTSFWMQPSNIRVDDWGLPSETKAESNPSSMMRPSKSGSGDFGLPSETSELNPVSSMQPSNTCELPSETTELNQMSLFAESGGFGLFWCYSSSCQDNYFHEFAT